MLTPAELETLLSHVAQHDQQFYVFLVLAAFTGARRAQLLALRWDKLSLANAVVVGAGGLGGGGRRQRKERGESDEGGADDGASGLS